MSCSCKPIIRWFLSLSTKTAVMNSRMFSFVALTMPPSVKLRFLWTLQAKQRRQSRLKVYHLPDGNREHATHDHQEERTVKRRPHRLIRQERRQRNLKSLHRPTPVGVTVFDPVVEVFLDRQCFVSLDKVLVPTAGLVLWHLAEVNFVGVVLLGQPVVCIPNLRRAKARIVFDVQQFIRVKPRHVAFRHLLLDQPIRVEHPLAEEADDQKSD